MTARKKSGRAPARKPARKPARRSVGKSASKRATGSAVRRRAVDENGAYFGCSYTDSELTAGETARAELVAQGVEIPTDWDGIRFFYITRPEISGFRCAIICRRDWRHFWARQKADNWSEDRERFAEQVKREALSRLARKRAKQLIDGFDAFASGIERVAKAIVDRAERDLTSTEPEPFETIASRKDENGALEQVRCRLPRPTGYQQIALLEKYLQVMETMLGIVGAKQRQQTVTAASAAKDARDATTQDDEAQNRVRMFWEAQNAMWETELGHDYDPDVPGAVGKRTAAESEAK